MFFRRADVDETTQTVATTMAGLRIGIGSLAILAPRLGMKLFGFPSEHDSGTARLMGRLFGIRNIVLGLWVLDSRDDPDQLAEAAKVNAAVDAADAAVIVMPLLRRQGIDRAAVSALATAIAAWAAFAWLRDNAR